MRRHDQVVLDNDDAIEDRKLLGDAADDRRRKAAIHVAFDHLQ